MINVYAATATTFTDNGLAIVQPVSSVIRQTINGEYALEAVFAQADAEHIVAERILVAEDAGGRQPFRIKEIEADAITDTVRVYATHIFYDLADHYIKDVYPTTDTGNEAITAILAATEDSHSFTGSSDITTVSSARYVMRSPVSCLLDTSEPNCFLNRWGGEILRDGFTVAINSRIGADNGVIIAYRKNLTGLTAHSDTSAVKTRVYPTGLTEKDAVLEGAAVDSAYIANYPHPKSTRAHFSDVKIGAEVDGAVPYPTQAAALAELQSRAEALFAAGIDLPSVSLDVQFVDLSQTEEYAQYAALESVSLGDTVTVKHEPLGMDLSLRVSAYEWDTELKRYISLTVGDIQPNIGQSVIDADIDISAINDSLTTMLKQNEKYNAVYINHDEGFVSTHTESGIEMKVRSNGNDGFELLADDVVVGKFAIIDGKARLVTSILADVTGGGDSYISMEPDPSWVGYEALRMFVRLTGYTDFYEICRITNVNGMTTMQAFPSPTNNASSIRLKALGNTSYPKESTIQVAGGSATRSIHMETTDGTNLTELLVDPNPTRGVRIFINGVLKHTLN